MTVEVEFFATLRLKLPKACYRVEMPEGATVRDLMNALTELVGTDFRDELFRGEEILPGTIVLVNGKNIIHLQGLYTPLESGKVVIFPPAGGG